MTISNHLQRQWKRGYVHGTYVLAVMCMTCDGMCVCVGVCCLSCKTDVSPMMYGLHDTYCLVSVLCYVCCLKTEPKDLIAFVLQIYNHSHVLSREGDPQTHLYVIAQGNVVREKQDEDGRVSHTIMRLFHVCNYVQHFVIVVAFYFVIIFSMQFINMSLNVNLGSSN